MPKFKWEVSRVQIKDVSVRMHTNPWTENEEPYAVVYVGKWEGEKEEDLLGNKSKKPRNVIMVFDEKYFRRLVKGEEYSFRGEVRFGYGNTYLVSDKIYDAVGYEVTEEESCCFDLYKSDLTDDIPFGPDEMDPPEIALED